MAQPTHASWQSWREAALKAQISAGPTGLQTNCTTDPLLSDISSPETIKVLLETCSLSDAVGSPSFPSDIVARATPSQRHFCVHVAQIADKVQRRCDELSAWQWPDSSATATLWAGSMETQCRSQSTRRQWPLHGRLGPEHPRLGCLTETLAVQYEHRLKAVREELDSWRIEDLKEHVLNTHIPSRTRPGSPENHHPAHPLVTGFTYLDDLTAISTATILQTLPCLERLRGLLRSWDYRLRVLWKIDPFLASMSSTEQALHNAWRTITGQTEPAVTGSELGGPESLSLDSEQAYPVRPTGPDLRVLQSELQSRICSVGEAVDAMLDDLDGQAEQLPDQWIDAVERLESEYAEWKLQVEQSELQHGITAHATLSSQVEVQDAEGGHGVDGEHIGYGGDVAIKEHPTTPPNRDLEAPSVPSSPISDLDSTEKFTKPLRSYERPNLVSRFSTMTASSVEHSPVLEPFTLPTGTSRNCSLTSQLEKVPASPCSDPSMMTPSKRTPSRESQSGTDFGREDRRPIPIQVSPPRRTLISKFSISGGGNQQDSPLLSPSRSDNLAEGQVRLRTTNFNEAQLQSLNLMRNISTVEVSQDMASYTQRAADGRMRQHKMIDSRERRVQSWLGSTQVTVPSAVTEPDSFSDEDESDDDSAIGTAEALRAKTDGLFPRRASAASIEVVNRGDVKSIQVHKRDRSLSARSTASSSQNTLFNNRQHPPPPSQSLSGTMDEHEHLDMPPSIWASDAERSPSLRQNRSNISLSIPKRPSWPGRVGNNAMSSATAKVVKGSSIPKPSKNSKSSPALPQALEEVTTSISSSLPKPSGPRLAPSKARNRLEAQITSILDTVPARIQLTHSDSDGEALEPTQPSVDGRDQTPTKSPKVHDRSETPAYILAPVHDETSKGPISAGTRRPGHVDTGSTTQLYHLRRAVPLGGIVEAPIKLFVRQVGADGEKIMVRVGGGWADLGDYLREYASHHSSGRRAVSDGRVQICDMATPTSTHVSSAKGTPSSSIAHSSPDDIRAIVNGETRVRKDDTRASSSPCVPGAGSDVEEAVVSLHPSRRSSSRLSWVKNGVEFGQLGTVRGTKRVFRKSGGL